MRELAERAVKAKGWRWMAGMGIWIGGEIVKRCVVVGARGPAYRDNYGRLTVVRLALPALDDPATLGCLLAILREVQGPCSCFKTVMGWRVYSAGGALWSQGKSEAEALVKALEDAG